MDYHKITMKGDLVLEKVITLPTPYDSDRDEGRLVYNLDDKKVYFGDNTSWNNVDMLSFLTAHEAKQLVVSSTDTSKEKHLSNAQAKKWEDHVDNTAIHNNFPTGTSMLFNQASAPTGWTKVTGWSTSSLNVGNVYASGGSNDPISWTTGIAVANHSNITPTVTIGDTTLTIDQIPSHSHFVPGGTGPQGAGGGFFEYTLEAADLETTTVGGGNSHTHTGSSASASISAHSITQSTFTPRYVTVIAANKD